MGARDLLGLLRGDGEGRLNMTTLRFILMILAFVCLFIAALQIGTPMQSNLPRINLTAMGLCLWLLAEMLRNQ